MVRSGRFLGLVFIFPRSSRLLPSGRILPATDGEVVDQSGARILGATITLTNTDTNVSRTAPLTMRGCTSSRRYPLEPTGSARS
jgi:hypothetical protein